MLLPDDPNDPTTWAFSADWENFEGDGTTAAGGGPDRMLLRGELSRFLFHRGHTVTGRDTLWHAQNTVVFVDTMEQVTQCVQMS